MARRSVHIEKTVQQRIYALAKASLDQVKNSLDRNLSKAHLEDLSFEIECGIDEEAMFAEVDAEFARKGQENAKDGEEAKAVDLLRASSRLEKVSLLSERHLHNCPTRTDIYGG